ncbi:MAG: hypothetical protein A2X35_01120 [Elusimicrobia bacterium GWA2_61_42]|nr:MAG: hypothetical protein A2X35_01120 [Elusimicrobia bacterium GWA2_61_42]OGR75185.1 MAG: hypothetical protein A2X38_04665 [Elusimicrobia bacterium GWC2_61_25]
MKIKLAGIKKKKRVLIVGAGTAGRLTADEMLRHGELNYSPIGFIDDSPAKRGTSYRKLKVLGAAADLAKVAGRARADLILISIPSATGAQVKTILAACRKTDLPVRIVPGYFEVLDSRARIEPTRRLRIEDILRRKPVKIRFAEIRKNLRNKRVLVTGAGGSIGSMLSEQLALLKPGKLVLLDNSENSLHWLKFRIKDRRNVVFSLSDIRDKAKVSHIFKKYRPDIVFHAAAYKHVPILERNVSEAVLNNVESTVNLIDCAGRHGAKELIFISTDKAVKPTSVLGKTKKAGEMYISAAQRRSPVKLLSVRFGNVVRSSGSVVEVFERQLEAGGPLTLTHPDVTRYFMSIDEACLLILNTVAISRGGEIFVLDMGEPVKVLDLARDLIRLRGLVPGADVRIKYTGLRPGEKLHEELYDARREELRASPHPFMMIIDQSRTPVRPEFKKALAGLIACARNYDDAKTRALLDKLVRL